MSTSDDPPPPPITTRSVWAHNLAAEFRIIRDVIDRFPYVSMDTEFPGVVYRQDYRSIDPFDHYQTLKSNVDALKLIQVGITLTDEFGNLPDLGLNNNRFIWEFNLADFDLVNDDHVPASIDLLRQQGINFDKNRKDGIKCSRFGDLMMSSGLVCNDYVTYVTFHGAYDFGYLIKTLTGRGLPGTLSGFLELLRVFFGERVYDVKHLMRYCRSYLHGGLNRVAETLALERKVGKSHQSGSDSLLTWDAFEKIRMDYFDGDDEMLQKYAGVLFGLDVLSA
ncbi:mRNA polyadenylation factor [Lithospermum erythrorhizon]|uniref:poly(A)-specific ribonuclease n=1 Tax=Lithospermum erythrorhizon TaxID=34254 RepID=A0AAV3PAT8_LITER